MNFTNNPNALLNQRRLYIYLTYSCNTANPRFTTWFSRNTLGAKLNTETLAWFKKFTNSSNWVIRKPIAILILLAVTEVLYMSYSFWLLAVESHDFFSSWERKNGLQSWANSQNDSHFWSKWQPRTILSENSCHSAVQQHS